MSFRLLIECSKDIDSLKINFSDGTSVINEKEPLPKKEPKENRKKLDTYLVTTEQKQVNQEIVNKPVIVEVQRPPNVTDELQNLDI